jgi:hypothetical protein
VKRKYRPYWSKTVSMGGGGYCEHGNGLTGISELYVFWPAERLLVSDSRCSIGEEGESEWHGATVAWIQSVSQATPWCQQRRAPVRLSGHKRLVQYCLTALLASTVCVTWPWIGNKPPSYNTICEVPSSNTGYSDRPFLTSLPPRKHQNSTIAA